MRLACHLLSNLPSPLIAVKSEAVSPRPVAQFLASLACSCGMTPASALMIAAPNTKVYRQKLHLLVELVNRRRYFASVWSTCSWSICTVML